jgi:hypothetical protein
MEQIIKILDQIKESEIKGSDDYKHILEKIHRETETRLRHIEDNKSLEQVKEIINTHPKFIKLMRIDVDHDIECMDHDYQRLDYHVSWYYVLKIGPLVIEHSYNGDNEGEGNQYVKVNKYMLTKNYDESMGPMDLDCEKMGDLLKELKGQGYDVKEKDRKIILKFIKDMCGRYYQWFD